MSPKRPPEREIGYLLADLSRLLRREFDRRVRDLGLTQSQWRAIGRLSREEGVNQATLAERLEMRPITIARLIDRMQAAGWVKRESDAADRRAVRLFLTPKAKPILAEMQARADEVLEVLFAGIPSATRSKVAQTLERMKQNLISAGGA